MRALGIGAMAAGLAMGAMAACGGSPGPSVTAPRFVSDSGGIDHRYTGAFPYFVGGGVAAFDCSDDGRSELYFAGGSSPAALYLNESSPGGPLRFAALQSPVTDLTAVMGAYPLDVDGDAETDLAVLRAGEDVILRGLGRCRFERANELFGIHDAHTWTAAFSATWEGSNHLPTMAFGDYLEPDRSGCADSRYMRPATEAGTRYAPSAVLSPGYCTLSMLFSDWHRSGRRDLRMTNDRHYYRDGTDQLWHFTTGETPRPYTESDGWRPLQIWGMGIASADLTGDGRPEVFLTSQADNKLQTLSDVAAGQPAYEDIALERGVTAHRPFVGSDVLPSTAWHAEFADVNNDGFLDLFVAKGNVDAEPGYATRDPSNLLLGRADGTFVEGAEAAGIVSYSRARGGALVDLNLDGMLDLAVVNRVEPVAIWRNVGAGDGVNAAAMGNWVAVRLRQPPPNVDAIGAWLEAQIGDRTIAREVTVGGGHAGGQLGWIHLGLGDAEHAQVRVQWPDGQTGPWMELRAGERVTIDRTTEAPLRWNPEETG